MADGSAEKQFAKGLEERQAFHVEAARLWLPPVQTTPALVE